jgi:hypothetical protein
MTCVVVDKDCQQNVLLVWERTLLPSSEAVWMELFMTLEVLLPACIGSNVYVSQILFDIQLQTKCHVTFSKTKMNVH